MRFSAPIEQNLDAITAEWEAFAEDLTAHREVDV